jgi:hypothetical protein
MLDIGIGLSLEENSFLAAEEAIKQAKAQLNDSEKIDLCLVFNSYDFSATGAIRGFSALLRDVPIIGASGPAIISDKGVFKHGIVVMLLGFPDGAYCRVAATRDINEKNPFNCGKELAEKLLLGFKNIPRNLGLLFFDQQIESGPNFVAGLQETLGKGFPCIGTSLSNQYDPSHSCLYLNGEAFNNSCAGILWGGKTTFGTGIRHGWKPLGKPHTVSSAVGNIINAIDGKPAIEIYEEYLGYDAAKLTKDLGKLSISYPIGLSIPGEKELLLRNVVSIEQRGALVCQGSIPEGSTVRLMISTPETCLAATDQAIEEAQKNLAGSLFRQNNLRNSRFAIVFSSISRYNLLRRDIKKELNIIKAGLKDTRFLGIYTSGELAPLTASSYHGQIYFHNQDFTVLIIEG